mgnify:CR=1 FL=1
MRQLLRGCYTISLILLALFFITRQPAAFTQQSNTSSFTFAAIGDSGTGSSTQFAVGRAMAEAHTQTPFDIVLMLGDNFYGGIDYAKKFEQPYASLLDQGVKFYAALGNHDGGKAEKETNYDKFNMGGRRYYTFNRGEVEGRSLAQFFALDSGQMTPAQLDWLRQELGKTTARWRIAYFHHPLYSSGKTHGSDLKLRALLEPIFVKHGVQLVLSGHDHFYERLKPQQGVQYFVSGAAGKIRHGDIKREDPALAFGDDKAQHFMLFEVKADALSFRAISDAGAVLDSGTLTLNPAERGAGAKAPEKSSEKTSEKTSEKN